MSKIGIIVLADGETHESQGRVLNALMTAREFKEAGEEVTVVFDGGGTQGAATFADPSNESHKLFEQVRDVVAGACEFCAEAFGVTEQMESAGIELLDEYRKHPSVKSLMDDGYEIVTF